MSTCAAHAIIEVINRYGAAIDAFDWERLKSCFTPDAVVQFPTRQLRGPDEIVRAISDVGAGMVWQQHLLASHQVTVHGDRATASCALYASQMPRDSDGATLTTIGTYHDQLLFTDGGWKLVHLQLDVKHRVTR